ncbi:hypothetical protein G7Y89_g4493 [Cudoniella acicularis]|uniref:Uncharacterized protein n=1 Tax=Cudoniella acicularis TaxID=354080 RepID=A0A8H4RPB9_9HELO|nr:hypothetical protein G7Y89_g4493 [Cudoniella acicularis]
MLQQHQRDHHLQRSRTPRALDQGSRQRIYREAEYEDDGNWSDSAVNNEGQSESGRGHVRLRPDVFRGAVYSDAAYRRRERPTQNLDSSRYGVSAYTDAYTNSAPYSGYKTGAGGQVFHYDADSNPFSRPISPPSAPSPPRTNNRTNQYTSRPSPRLPKITIEMPPKTPRKAKSSKQNQHQPSYYPTGRHPIRPYPNNEDPSHLPGYFSESHYLNPMEMQPPSVYPNSRPPNPFEPRPTTSYEHIHTSEPTPSIVSPMLRDDQLD